MSLRFVHKWLLFTDCPMQLRLKGANTSEAMEDLRAAELDVHSDWNGAGTQTGFLKQFNKGMVMFLGKWEEPNRHCVCHLPEPQRNTTVKKDI